MPCPHCGDPTGIRCCEFGADRGPNPSAQTTGILLTAYERVIAQAALTALLEVWAGAEAGFGVKPLPYADDVRELIEKLA